MLYETCKIYWTQAIQVSNSKSKPAAAVRLGKATPQRAASGLYGTPPLYLEPTVSSSDVHQSFQNLLGAYILRSFCVVTVLDSLPQGLRIRLIFIRLASMLDVSSSVSLRLHCCREDRETATMRAKVSLSFLSFLFDARSLLSFASLCFHQPSSNALSERFEVFLVVCLAGKGLGHGFVVSLVALFSIALRLIFQVPFCEF